MSEIIYHYTSLETLIAILEQSNSSDKLKLRATHIEYLNDASEYKRALNILREELIKHEENLVDEENKGLKNFKHIQLMEMLKNPTWDNMPPLITSFSKERDSLPMWNMYADNSLGVALGFEKEVIKGDVEKQGFRFAKCLYDQQEITASFSSDIERIYDCISISDKSFGTLTSFGSTPLDSFRNIVSIVKNNSFKYEKEWRIIIKQKLEQNNLSFNFKNKILKPYYQFEIPKISLKEIIIGPCSNFDLISKPLFMLLKQVNIKSTIYEDESRDVIIKKSKCPYRNI